MIEEPLQLSIKILDKEYRIACEFHEQDDLKASARLLDNRMRDIRQTGRVIGTDRIAVMAALNIAYDLIQLQRARSSPEGDLTRRLQQLQNRVQSALAGDADDEPTAQQPAHNPPPSNTEPSVTSSLDAPRERV
ncbi:cell division protein ZapA [Allochromatium warmingii]|uniref:Cell division protein ZapA n=1 Tax=Allochromatium warmingii TaxID=61595 RepID=A0A1H3GFM5_ALLWA|nr:cell division protein ZapA [Allochromatium warmingii]SDY01870.1 cell division protein ZapA [Allochromatium warmingii]